MPTSLFLLFAGCGGGSDKPSDAAAPLPACAAPRKTIPRPAALPPELPVPPGTVFTSVEQPFPQQHVIGGASPGSIDAARAFFEDALGEAGFKQRRSESEPGETEAVFTGPGSRGGWRANTIPRCDGAVRLTLVVIRD